LVAKQVGMGLAFWKREGGSWTKGRVMGVALASKALWLLFCRSFETIS
jgi:hypothetical protein